MMEVLFYIAATVALLSTGLALTRANAAHALIYLIVSLLAVAVLFFLMGAPFAAALELSLIHISEPTRPVGISRMPSSA